MALSHAAPRDVLRSVTITFVENSTGALVVTLIVIFEEFAAVTASGNHTKSRTAGHDTVVFVARGDSVIAFVCETPPAHAHVSIVRTY